MKGGIFWQPLPRRTNPLGNSLLKFSVLKIIPTAWVKRNMEVLKRIDFYGFSQPNRTKLLIELI
jgi:hypothetical protein